MIKGYIEKLLTVASVFFDSIFENEHMVQTRKGKILKVFLNLMYAALISIPLGFIIQVVFFIAISSLTGFKVAEDINLFVIIIFLFICLSGIILLNYKDQSFSLPRSVLNSYIVFQLIKPVKGIWKTIIFIGIITISLMLTLAGFLSSFTIPEQYYREILFIIFVISLFISMILYSEATKKEIKRKKRQFIFSMLTFLVFLALNIYQMVVYINAEPSNETIIFIAITILGLILSMVTAIDKTRCLFEAVIQLKQVEIDEKWNVLNEKYSYRIGLKMVDDKKNEINETFEIIKIKWNNSNYKKRIEIIAIFSIFALIELFIVSCIFNQKKIEYYVNLFFTEAKELIILLFNGDEKKASLSFVIIIIIAIMIYLRNDTKKNLNHSSDTYKIKLIVKIEFILLILFVYIYKIIPICSKFIIQYFIFLISILFVATILIGSIYLKLKDDKKES